jgi:hypothetical protein
MFRVVIFSSILLIQFSHFSVQFSKLSFVLLKSFSSTFAFLFWFEHLYTGALVGSAYPAAGMHERFFTGRVFVHFSRGSHCWGSS